MKSLIILICLTGVLLSCAKKEQSSEASRLYAESMAIHDQLMPRMDEVLKLRGQLAKKLDALKTDSATNAAEIQKVSSALDQLNHADKAMMDWMHNIKDLPGATEGEHSHGHHGSGHHVEPQTPEQILEEQKAQKASIEKIRENMEESMESARQLID